jgi:hypothetical protein
MIQDPPQLETILDSGVDGGPFALLAPLASLTWRRLP